MSRLRTAVLVIGLVPALAGAGSVAARTGGPVGPAGHDVFFAARSRGVEEMAEALESRSRGLDLREKTLVEREADLRAAEERLTRRMEELEATRAALEGLLRQRDERETAQVAALVRMVEGVRAKDAAPIVAELDEALAVQILGRMNRTKGGKLLAEMPPAKAASLAARLARTPDAAPGAITAVTGAGAPSGTP